MKKYGELAYLIIVESYQPFTFKEYQDKCKDYNLEVTDEDLRFVLDKLIERKHLEVDKDNELISLNYEHSNLMDDMALNLQFSDDVAKLFAKAVNKHDNVNVCFDYLPEIAKIALDETIRKMMK